MKDILLVAFLCISSVCLSQKFINIRFESTPEQENKYKVFFEYKRIFLDDLIFKEEGLFSRDTLNNNTTTIFKIRNDKWYFKKNKKWFIFFDKEKDINSVILINGDKYLLNWCKTNLIDKESKEIIYLLKLNPIGFRITGLPQYLFTLKDGIIAIDGHNMLLIREDKKYLWELYK